MSIRRRLLELSDEMGQMITQKNEAQANSQIAGLGAVQENLIAIAEGVQFVAKVLRKKLRKKNKK